MLFTVSGPFLAQLNFEEELFSTRSSERKSTAYLQRIARINKAASHSRLRLVHFSLVVLRQLLLFGLLHPNEESQIKYDHISCGI